jgi:hypothetical protein
MLFIMFRFKFEELMFVMLAYKIFCLDVLQSMVQILKLSNNKTSTFKRYI